MLRMLVSELMVSSLTCCVVQSAAGHRSAPLGVFGLLHGAASPPAGLGSGQAAPPAVAGLGDRPSSGLHSGQPQQQDGVTARIRTNYYIALE